MRRCEICGSELPDSARFCGYCGRLANNMTREVSEINRLTELGVRTPHTPPPLLNNPSHPNSENPEIGQRDVDMTIQTGWMNEGNIQNIELFEERQTDERRTVLPFVLPEHAVLDAQRRWQDGQEQPDMMFPGILIEGGQAPGWAGHVPMVQGTPQLGGVPAVHGTPSLPANPPAGQIAYHNAPGMSPSAPQHAPSWNPQPHLQPTRLPQHKIEHPHQPTQPSPPHHPLQPTPPPGKHQKHQHHQHHTVPRHTPKHHAPGVHGAASKLVIGTTTKWVILAVTAVVVIVSSGIGFVLANPPALALTGSSSVMAGSMLSLHGKGFFPGGSVTLTLDNGLTVSAVGHGATGNTAQRFERGVSHGSGASVGGGLQMLVAGQIEQQASANTSVAVSSSGTFDANVQVSATLLPGVHTIHATEGIATRSADLKFTVLAPPANLAVSPSILDFGTLEMDRKAVLSVAVSNAGGQRLSWKAQTDGSKWLTLRGSAGVLEFYGSQEFMYVTADTSHLKVGDYTASLQIHSNGGDSQVTFKLHVVMKGTQKQARLDVTPTSLDFGQVQTGKQVLLSDTLSNLGTLALNWQATAGSTSWLSLDTSSGTIQPGASPQTIHVIASTVGLAAGSYTATLTINSNGGNAQIAVTLSVSAAQGGGTPTPSPTPPTAVLIGSPNSFGVPGDPNCSYTTSVAWTCTASLSSLPGAQSNLNWSASSSGISGVTFSPSSGMLIPGQTTQVTITIPNTVCPASADFTFTGPANTVDMPWSCTAPTLSATKSSLNGNTDCTYSNGWTCSLSLSSDQNAQGNLNWSASGSGINGISFSPSNGTLSPGQSIAVTITVPNTSCPASANLSFSGQGSNMVTVPWSCAAVSLQVSKSSFNGNTDCTYNNGWSCTETLSLSSNNSGDPSLNWSASGSGINGISFSPQSGTLPSGQTASVTISIPGTTCPASASLSFTAQGANTVNVSWNCTPPQLSVTPGSINANTDCTWGGIYSWSCTLTVSSSSSAQTNLDWSTSSSGFSDQGFYVNFSPASGTLSPGQSIQVSISIASTSHGSCSPQGFTATLTFSGPGNTVNIPWTCTSPNLAVSPSSLQSTDCTYVGGSGWTCTVTLSQQSQGFMSWSTSSSGINGITFNPDRGGFNQPGTIGQVTISIPDTVCPASATLTFTGIANTVNVPWTCNSSPNPPTLTANPTSLNTTNCTFMTNIWECVETLTETSSSNGNLTWSASSKTGAQFSPQSGTLSPGQSVTVILTVGCVNDTFTFSGGVNPVTVPWTCSSSSSTIVTHGSMFLERESLLMALEDTRNWY